EPESLRNQRYPLAGIRTADLPTANRTGFQLNYEGKR
ncbi:hypothetical protein X975_05882, partial [Stegodyphus mimosarum]